MAVNTLAYHTGQVFRASFSHSGDYIASGSRDRTLCIWSVKTGMLIRSFKGNAPIFDLNWSSDDSKIAVCFNMNNASVIDLRK